MRSNHLKLISRKQSPSTREWVGGRVRMPIEVDEGGGVFPDLLLWIDGSDGSIITGQAVAPEDPEPNLGTLLAESLRSPGAGSPRKPTSLRVASPALVREIRAVIGDSIPVRLEPTPEIDDAARSFMESLRPDLADPEQGLVPEKSMEGLLRASRVLAVVRPWRAIDACLLRVDIPAYDVKAACLSFINPDNDDKGGFLLFPSREACFSFGESLPEGELDPDRDFDFGTSWMGITFVDRDEVPPALPDDARAHGWDFEEIKYLPLVQKVGRDGSPVPLSERDVQVIVSCAAAVSALAVRDGHRFAGRRAGPIDPILTSMADSDGTRVFLSGPYDEYDLPDPSQWGDIDEGPALQWMPGDGFGCPVGAAAKPRKFQPSVSKNGPCPCGSGQKYKKCCLEKDHAEAERETVHERDRRLVDAIHAFAFSTFGVDWIDMTQELEDAEEILELAVPWSAYVAPVDDRPLVDWFLESGNAPDPVDCRWLEAQQASWFSVWEVRAVEPGRSLRLWDPLSEVEHHVTETSASQSLRKGMRIMARIVAFDGEGFLCGIHPRALLPLAGDEVVAGMRKRLRRKSAVPIERLREYRHARALFRKWDEAVFDADARAKRGPVIRTPGGRDILARELLEQLERGDATSLGFLHSDEEDDNGGVGIDLDDAQAAVRSWKRQHYAGWPDVPVPALGNQTPRAAMKTPEGRRRVAALIEEMELMESRDDPEVAYDFGELRRALGLE